MHTKTISRSVTINTPTLEIFDTIRSGDNKAYILELTYSDLTAIDGTVSLHFELGTDPKTYADRDASDGVTVSGNKITYELEEVLYSAAGLVCYVQFVDSNLYTPLRISFIGIRIVPGGTSTPSLVSYPAWVTSVASAEAARVIAAANQAVWEAFDPDKVYAVGNKAYYSVTGSSYIMHTVSGVAGTLPTDTDHWAIIVQKGDQGIQGLKGDTGDAGTITAGSTNTAMTGLIAGNGTKIAAPTAAQVGALPIPDTGSYFATDTVDGALQSVGAQLAQKANIAQEAWIEPTLAADVTIPSGFDCKYIKDNFGLVHIKGCVSTTAASLPKTLFTLPAGYRPLISRGFALQANNTSSTICYVTSGGAVVLAGSVKSYIFLDPIIFMAGV